MLCLETSFLVDYLQGADYTRGFLKGLEDSGNIRTPTIALWEVYVGALLSNASGASVARTAEALDWATPIPFTDGAAQEAADIRVDLRQQGKEIQVPDALIAGIARDADAELVTRDDHFERVEGLRVRDPVVAD